MRELRDLTTNVLHDLRTPLTQISGDAESVCRGETDAADAATRTLDSCRTIIRLIDNAIKFTPDGGEIRCASTPGRGTTFTVELPRRI